MLLTLHKQWVVSFCIYMGHFSPDFEMKNNVLLFISVDMSCYLTTILNTSVNAQTVKTRKCKALKEVINRSIEEISTSYAQLWMKRTEREAEQMTMCIMVDSVSCQCPVPVGNDLLVSPLAPAVVATPSPLLRSK